MFIVQKQEAVSKTIRMPEKLIEQLEQVAQSEDISFSQLVIQCCEYALDNLPKSESKITSTEMFLKCKQKIRVKFIAYMQGKTKASEQTLTQMFSDAIYCSSRRNAALNIDLYSVLCGQVSMDEYSKALVAYLTKSGNKDPANVARGNVNALQHLKTFMEQEGMI